MKMLITKLLKMYFHLRIKYFSKVSEIQYLIFKKKVFLKYSKYFSSFLKNLFGIVPISTYN